MNQCNICGKWTEALMPVVVEAENPDDNELIDICPDCYDNEVMSGSQMHFASDVEMGNDFLQDKYDPLPSTADDS